MVSDQIFRQKIQILTRKFIFVMERRMKCKMNSIRNCGKNCLTQCSYSCKFFVLTPFCFVGHT